MGRATRKAMIAAVGVLFLAAAGWAQVRVVGVPQTNAAPPVPVPPPPGKRLADPAAAEIPVIVQKFTSAEKVLRGLLARNYTYTESIDFEILDGDGNPVGQSYRQINDIQYTPDGQRQIVCTWCPQPTLRDIGITQEDIDDFFNMDMYTIDVDELADYDLRYEDHEPLDQLTVYRFSVTPKSMEKGKRYFEGTIWVDDHDLQIVKSEGKAVPDEYDKHGNPTNVFPPITTYRVNVDGKYWFPAYTDSHSMIFGFPIKMIVQFKNYKRFGATTRIIYGAPVPPKPHQ